MNNTAIGVVLAACILGLYALASIDDNRADYEAAQDIENAISDGAAAARYERAVQDMCGANAGWIQLEGGVVQCYLKNGSKTRQVRLTESGHATRTK
jgi:hypothetical protein